MPRNLAAGLSNATSRPRERENLSIGNQEYIPVFFLGEDLIKTTQNRAGNLLDPY